MASEWSMSELGQVVNIQTGKLDSNKADTKGIYPFFTCAPEPLKINNFAFDCDAVLLAGNNANGIFHLNRYCGKFNAYQRTYVITPKKNETIDLRFLFYQLHTLTQRLGEYSQGTATKFLTIKILSSLSIPLPPLSEQLTIAHILGTLDDKIELNRWMNETLEAMALAIFKSWFVDFDPVRAKAEGRDTGLPKEIADLFPDSFEDTELGEVPRGWLVKAFTDTIEVLGGGTPKTSMLEYWNGDIPWFSVVDAPSDFDIWVVDTEKKITQLGVNNSSTRILSTGTTIISARGTVGKVALVGVSMAMNQSCYGLKGKYEDKDFFTYFSTRALVSDLQQKSHGSVFNTITKDTLKGVNVVLPPSHIIQSFERRVAPILWRIRENVFESRTLAELRDTLLPKLISGKLRVNEAEKLVRCET